MRGRVPGKESDTTEDVLAVSLSVIFQSSETYTDCIFNILTLKICNLCVIKFVFLRGLLDNDISILNNFYLFIHALLFSRKDFRWPDSILTVIPVPMLTPPFRK